MMETLEKTPETRDFGEKRMKLDTHEAEGTPRRERHPRDYANRLAVNVPRERVFDAITTIDGLRSWLTTDVTGSAAIGDVLRFGYALATHDEWFVMRVDGATHPSLVQWSCVAQHVAPKGLTKHDEWMARR